MTFRSLSLAAAVFVIAACQSAPAAHADVDAPNAALYGDYLAASYAMNLEDAPSRFRYIKAAFDEAPDDARIGRRALVAALNANDLKAAVKLAERVYAIDKTDAMARGVLGINAWNRKRPKAALRYFEGPSDDITMSILMQITKGWIQAEQDDFDAAKETFETLGGAEYFENYRQLLLAKLALMQGDLDTADTALTAMEETGLSGVETGLTRARWHVEKGDRAGAKTALEALLEENDGLKVGPVGRMIKRLDAGGDVDTDLSARRQAAVTLTDPSWAFFARNRSRDGAELFLRMANWVDPGAHKANIWLGTMLEQSERDEEAYALYEVIGEDSDYYVSAQLNEANIHFSAKEDEKAIELLEKLNARENTFQTRETLGRARFFRENYDEALPYYDALIESMSDADIEANVEPLRFRGIIHERLKNWPAAEADFKRVLSLKPDDVDTLNYLGYTWVDRGENLKEAFDMIRRAVEMEPQSGAIVDSLGWAHYKLGEYGAARINLEKAVELSPSSATIIDHLGDVYWKLGRKREAGYQWTRALDYDPTDEEREAINVKLAKGLDALPVSQDALP